MSIIKTLLTNLFGRRPDTGATTNAPPRTVQLETQPDFPEDFGLKMNWFAIKTSDVNAVLKVLNFGSGSSANWSSGIRAAYDTRARGFDKDLAFVTPPIDGWVIVAGAALPYPVMHTPDRHEGIGDAFDVLFSRLAASFSDVQFFGSYRVVDFVAWARRKMGEPDRIFAFGDGDVYANVGKQTADEVLLGLPNLDDLSLEEATARMFEDEAPFLDEEAPLLLAGRWSINPGKLSETSLSAACGVVVELPRIKSYR
ncbi:hypothetical protein [Xanthomonas maliensis]|uniref:hypothetical protein n=1 Tax=Xanthomonas maliensis TaxID=1321368 RepID=UPI0012654FE5|nr:hypothetical protein [Xanthomonas maliensis]